METTFYNQTLAGKYTGKVTKPSLLSRFAAWCEGQQENRIMWIGIALAGHGCVLTPLTVMAVLVAGNSLALFMAATAAMAMAVVTNLAAMPTKVTIPVFFLSVLIDIVIVAAAVSGYFN
jgi:hypothetical protein